MKLLPESCEERKFADLASQNFTKFTWSLSAFGCGVTVFYTLTLVLVPSDVSP